MATIVWLIGAPGAGKTTLIRDLLQAAKPSTVVTIHKPKWTLVNGVLVLAGHYTGETFDGADRVAYNGVNAALDYWFEIRKGISETLTTLA
jgi:ABC-type Mn2+/Zn2+ transport system ATPase subunit